MTGAILKSAFNLLQMLSEICEQESVCLTDRHYWASRNEVSREAQLQNKTGLRYLAVT